MSFDWSEFCAFADRTCSEAESLPTQGQQEAALRVCVSRAYYGVFNLCYRRLGQSWGSRAAGRGKHQWTIERFQRYANRSDPPSRIADWNKIGADLDRLREYRNNADYDDTLGDDPYRRATAATRKARKIVELLNKHAGV